MPIPPAASLSTRTHRAQFDHRQAVISFHPSCPNRPAPDTRSFNLTVAMQSATKDGNKSRGAVRDPTRSRNGATSIAASASRRARPSRTQHGGEPAHPCNRRVARVYGANKVRAAQVAATTFIPGTPAAAPGYITVDAADQRCTVQGAPATPGSRHRWLQFAAAGVVAARGRVASVKAPATCIPMTTASVIRTNTIQSCGRRFLPMRAPLVLRDRPLAFHRHHGPLHRLADASTDPTVTYHQIGLAPITSHDRSGTIQISIEQQRATTTLAP